MGGRRNPEHHERIVWRQEQVWKAGFVAEDRYGGHRERVDDWRPILAGPTPATDRLTRPDFGAPPVRA